MSKQELLRKYLDGELTPEEEKKALHIIADDEELRSALHFDLFLRQSLREPEFAKSSFDVPDGFTDKVMMQIMPEEVSPESSAPGFVDQITDWVEGLFTPRNFQLKPAYAVAILLLAITLPSIPFYLTTTNNSIGSVDNHPFQVQTVAEKEDQVMVRFIYVDDDAQNIEIAGDFNDWNPVSLDKQQVNGQDVWSGFVTMSRGEHKYMFIVDGEKWVTDPLANMYEDDGFGNKNALIYL